MWVVLGLTLVSGIGAGVVLDRLVLIEVFGQKRHSRDHASYRQRYIDKLDTELGLSADQKARLEQILEAAHEQVQTAKDRARAEYRKLRQQARDQIRSILDQEQQRRFDEMMARHDRERRDGRKRRR
jgi:hypothetical protein